MLQPNQLMLFSAVIVTECAHETFNTLLCIRHFLKLTVGGKHSYHYAAKANIAFKYSFQFLNRLYRTVLNTLTPELNLSAQRSLTSFFYWVFCFLNRAFRYYMREKTINTPIIHSVY
jgi:hypothetical protein